MKEQLYLMDNHDDWRDLNGDGALLMWGHPDRPCFGLFQQPVALRDNPVIDAAVQSIMDDRHYSARFGDA